MTDTDTPMTPPRRAKLVLLVLAIALVGLGVWSWEPMWEWAMSERVYSELDAFDLHGLPRSLAELETAKSHRIRGWWHYRRDRPKKLHTEGSHILYFYVESGLVAYNGKFHLDGRREETYWHADGTVWYQKLGAGRDRIVTPPWLWGVTDQTEPTMPEWVKDDAKWQAALDAQE